MKDIEKYIIEFLLYGNKDAVSRVHLSAPVDWTLRYPDISLLPTIERIDEEQVVVSPNLIYNTFFFISRAEELLNPQRDEHGRFAAKYSILGQSNRLQIPLVDEYGRLLMKAFNLPMPTADFANICLTHDIDTIDYYHHLRGAIGGILRGQWAQVLDSWKDIHNDPAYTFQWLENQDSLRKQEAIDKYEVIYFVKQTRGKGFDYPQYPLSRVPRLKARLGLHSSYYGELPKQQWTLHRSHYLRCSIDQMQKLADYGITDDYTMGFADCAGFRLQTCRPVRWINPKTMKLTNLVLHPLTIMDCTLSNENYMNLNEDEAYFYCQELISRVREHHGELVLLWHNHVFESSYHRSLYSKLLDSL